MKTIRPLLFLSLALFLVAGVARPQSGREYRRSAVMNGNQVRTRLRQLGCDRTAHRYAAPRILEE